MRRVGWELCKLWRRLWWVLILCLLAKAALCILLPEQKDTRIAMSRHQYDLYMQRFSGETTPEKEAAIRAEYTRMLADREALVQRTDTDSDAYRELSWRVQEDELRFGALSIFYEKTEQFAALCESLPTAHPWFFYEYGWDTVFAYYAYPDALLLLCAVLAAAQTFCGEYAAGMMGLLRAARYGRQPLWRSKAAALTVLVVAATAAHTAVEWGVFAARFSLTNGAVPFYSLTPFAAVPREWSIWTAAANVAAWRAVGVWLIAAVVMGAGVWLRQTIPTVFLAVAAVFLPLLLRAGEWQCLVFPFTALLSGTWLLQRYGHTGVPWRLLVTIVAGGVAAAVWVTARRRYVGRSFGG